MTYLIIVFFFLLGLIVGSFLNVVILRYNTGKGIDGRSECLSCRAKLSWLELIPVFSFIGQKGRCLHCHSKISIQYPLVEISTAVIFTLLAYNLLPDITQDLSFLLVIHIFWLLAGISILIAISGYDLLHKIIPDKLVVLLIIVALADSFFLVFSDGAFYAVNRVAGGLLAGAILYFFFWALWKYSEGRWMGLGDGKLSFAIGLFLGFQPALTAIVLAFWIGAVVGLLLIIATRITSLSRAGKYLTIKSEMPFAPFIALGAILQLVFDLNVFDYI